MSTFFFVMMGMGLLMGILLLSVFWWLDRYGLRSGLFALIPALWGALVLPLFHISGSALGIEGLLYWSLAEVLILIPGLLLVLGLSRFFQGPVDGWLLGSLAGFGLALAEVFGTPSLAGGILFSRHLSTILGFVFLVVLEMSVGSILGLALGCGRVSGRQLAALGCFPGALLVGLAFKVGTVLVLKHIRPELFVVVVLVLTCVWLGLLALLLGFEARLIENELKEEVELRVLPRWSLERFPLRRRRLRSDWGANLGERRVLNSMAVYLAFRKHALRRSSVGSDLKGLEIVRLREGLKARLSVVRYPGTPEY